ncbi:MAG: hypothetical protein Ta2B_14820 [Termitinemataceae bacterium]|nr:MAG: hypothetical protein Ta2B_14820 [Termitinemataceae bacterium]
MKKIYCMSLLLFVFFITLGIRIYWLTQKGGFHWDESLSVTISYYNEYGWGKEFPQGEPMSGKEIKDFVLRDNGTRGSIATTLGDVYRLRKDNRDPPHTNFYYSLFRIFLTGLKTGNIHDIIPRGGALNLVLFSIQFFVFFALMQLFFKNNFLVQIIATFCTFMSTATISSALFFRPYQLQGTIFVVFVYFFFRSLTIKKTAIIEGKIFIEPYSIIYLSFISSLTLLTGYYAIFFIGLFGVYVIYFYIKQKNQNEIFAYICILVLSIVMAQILYLKYMQGFQSGRALETASTIMGSSVFGNIKSSLVTIIKILHTYYFSLPVLATILLIFIYLIVSKNKIVLPLQHCIVFVIAIIYTLVVTFLAPLKILRYSMPVYSFFIIFPMLLLTAIKHKKIQYVFMGLLCISFSFNIFNENKMEYVYKNKFAEYQFTQDEALPVFIVGVGARDLLVPYLADNQTYIFIDSMNDLNTQNVNNDFYVVCWKSSLEDAKKVIDQNFYIITSVFDAGYNADRNLYKFSGMQIQRVE